MRLIFTFLIALIGTASSSCFALAPPNERVILTVTGAIDATNHEKKAQFDVSMLTQLPQHTITTHNPWTNGLHTYQGFSAVDLLNTLGSTGKLLQVTALNEYMTEIPLSDFVDHGAIFAIYLDGKPMSVRNLGPIMVVYPFDNNDHLKSELFYGRSIWQVNRINVIADTQ